MSFAKTSAKDRPNLVCIGSVSLGEIKVTNSGDYQMAKFKITASQGYDAYDNLLFRPEWLSPRFNPDSLKGNRSFAFVYANCIGGSDGHLSKLQGICGDAAAFATLEQKQEAKFATEEPTPDTAETFIADAFKDNDGVQVGYVLKQATEDAGVDDNGKKRRVKLDKYEVSEFFWPTDKSLARYRKMAERNPDKWKCAFDEAF
jgi:hypothetical protein